MNRLKFILRIGGAILFLVGMICLPMGYGHSPKRDLNVFNNIADMGAFIKIGLLLMGIGVIAFVLSFVVRGEMDPEYWD